jgi:predicted metal-dependent phosphoesterase TrpH
MAGQAVKKGLLGLAITDHNNLDGYNKLTLFQNLIAIAGEEIDTDKGEILGLFLNEPVRPGPIESVLDQLHSQDAFVSIPHPFDRFRRHIDPGVLDKTILSRIHAIEVYNSRIVHWPDNQTALEFATKHNKLQSAGSDAHFPGELGASGIIVEAETEEEVRKAIFSGKFDVRGKPNTPLYHAGTKLVKFYKRQFRNKTQTR